MRGHIRERSPGHWAIVIDVRDPATGKRKRKWHSFAGNKRAAQVECARLIAEASAGTALDPTKTTVREFMQRWLAHIATQVSPRSAENYREVTEHWIQPALGNVKLAKLQPEQIAQTYSNALSHGGRNARGLSPGSVVMMHRTLSQALKQAVAWKLIGSNPAALCKPPRIERKHMKVLDMAATASLIEFAKGGRALGGPQGRSSGNSLGPAGFGRRQAVSGLQHRTNISGDA
jgi:integrase-like protein